MGNGLNLLVDIGLRRIDLVHALCQFLWLPFLGHVCQPVRDLGHHYATEACVHVLILGVDRLEDFLTLIVDRACHQVAKVHARRQLLARVIPDILAVDREGVLALLQARDLQAVPAAFFFAWSSMNRVFST